MDGCYSTVKYNTGLAWMDGWIDGRIQRQTDRQTDKQTDRQTDRQTDTHTHASQFYSHGHSTCTHTLRVSQNRAIAT